MVFYGFILPYLKAKAKNWKDFQLFFVFLWWKISKK